MHAIRRAFCASSSHATKTILEGNKSLPYSHLRDFKFGSEVTLGIDKDSTPKVIHDYL